MRFSQEAEQRLKETAGTLQPAVEAALRRMSVADIKNLTPSGCSPDAVFTKNTVIVYFGASGDLFGGKAVEALWQEWLKHRHEEMRKWRTVIGTGSRPCSQEMFRAFIHEKINPSAADEAEFALFVSTFKYVQGSCSTSKGFKPIKDELQGYLDAAKANLEADACLLFYFAVPPQGMCQTMEQMASLQLHQIPHLVKCALLEKPSAVHEEDLDALMNASRSAGFAEEEVLQVDHFFFKDGLRRIARALYLSSRISDIYNGGHVERITLVIRERKGSDGRFDYPGTFMDSFLNHCLALVALLTINPFTQGKSPAERLVEPLETMANQIQSLYNPEKSSLSPDALNELKRNMRPVGGIAYTDGNWDAPEQPTALYFAMNLDCARFKDFKTRLVVIHEKCSSEKCMYANIVYRDRPPVEIDMLRFADFLGLEPAAVGIDLEGHQGAVVPDLQICGIGTIDSGLNFADEGGTYRSDLRPLSKYAGDGYARLFSEFIGKLWRAENLPHNWFLSVKEFQRAAIGITQPLAQQLQFRGRAGGYEFVRGTKPFDPEPHQVKDVQAAMYDLTETRRATEARLRKLKAEEIEACMISHIVPGHLQLEILEEGLLPKEAVERLALGRYLKRKAVHFAACKGLLSMETLKKVYAFERLLIDDTLREAAEKMETADGADPGLPGFVEWFMEQNTIAEGAK